MDRLFGADHNDVGWAPLISDLSRF